MSDLEESIGLVLGKAKERPVELGATATDLLRQFGIVALGFVWLRMAKVAIQGQAEEKNSAFYAGKLSTARFFIQRVLPEARFRAAAIASGSNSVMEMPTEQF